MKKSFKVNDFLKNSSKSLLKLKKKVEELKRKQAELYEQSIPTPIKPKKEKAEEIVMHISAGSVAKATLVVIGLILLTRFLGQISEIILIFFISILFAAALDPTVDTLAKYRIPRGVSVIGIFIILIFILGFFISQLVPLVAVEMVELVKTLTNLFNKFANDEIQNLSFLEPVRPVLQDFLEQVDKEAIIEQVKNYVESLGSELQKFAGDTFGVIKAVFNGIFNFILVLILTFFLTIEEKNVNQFFVSLFPSKHGQYVIEKMEAIKLKIGLWLRGILSLMVIMFTLSLIGFLILGIDYALTLAMMLGIAELMPVVGPIMATVPGVLVAFNESPWLAVWALGLYLLLQQIESNITIPIVMRKAVGLNPIVIILSMLIGYTSLGILGMIIAIPVATSVSIFVSDYTTKEK